MLTRLEIDGFKNLLDVTVEFGPYTCVVGPNGVGRSNLFDAIQLLSQLADRPIMQAAASVRGAAGRRADPRGLFWSDGDSHGTLMRFAAEMIVPPSVRDDFGRDAKATTTFLRYELDLAYVDPVEPGGFGRIELRREQLVHINKTDAGKRLRFPLSAKQFRDKVVDGHRSGTAYISTEVVGGTPVIKVHQDGGSRGQPKEAALRARSTVVGSTSDAGYPTILAARREMQSWRTLALEPSKLRAPDDTEAISPELGLSGDGAHLPFQLEQDPRVGGLVCTEEPENGIHPVRMRAMYDLVRGLAVDPDFEPGPDNPFRQVIVNTHAVPYLNLHLQQHRGDLLFAESVLLTREGRATRAAQFRPVEGTWRAAGHPSPVTPAAIKSFLEVALGDQLRLFVPGAA